MATTLKCLSIFIFGDAIPASAHSQIVYLHNPSDHEAHILDKLFKTEDTYKQFYNKPKFENGLYGQFTMKNVLVARARITSSPALFWIISVDSSEFSRQEGTEFQIWNFKNDKWIYLGDDYLRDENYITVIDRKIDGYYVIRPPSVTYNLVMKDGEFQCEANCPQ